MLSRAHNYCVQGMEEQEDPFLRELNQKWPLIMEPLCHERGYLFRKFGSDSQFTPDLQYYQSLLVPGYRHRYEKQSVEDFIDKFAERICQIEFDPMIKILFCTLEIYNSFEFHLQIEGFSIDE